MTIALLMTTACGLLMLHSGMLKKQLAWKRRRRDR